MASLWRLFKQTPIFVPTVYAVLASLWIFFSDRALAALVDDPLRLTQLQTYKGWFFVAATTLLLALLIRWRQRAMRELNASLERRVRERTAALENANQALARVIEDLERTRDELVRSGKLGALGAMVAGVAHQLNTPIGNSRVVASTLSEESTTLQRAVAAGTLRKSSFDAYLTQTQAAAELILNNLGKASTLVDSFKQLATDRASTPRQRFPLDKIVNEVQLGQGPRAERLRWRIPDDLTLDSFPGPLAQVLTQLIENAFIHGLRDGQNDGAVEVSASDGGNGEIVLSVADNGVGIAERDLPHIFDPFFSTRFGSGGCGLGLHVAHHLVRDILGGRIDIANRHSGGTEVILRLPRQAPDAG